MPVQHHLRLGPDELAGNGGLGRDREELAGAGVVASEMEASTLFVLASAAAPWCGPIDANWDDECQAGAVLAVFGTYHSDTKLDLELLRLAERRATDVAIAGTRVWARQDRRVAGAGS